MKFLLLLLFSLAVHALAAQSFKVEYNKQKSLSHIRTFQINNGDIVTSKAQKSIPDTTLHRWINAALANQLTSFQLTQQNVADVVVTYYFSIEARTNYQVLGPLAQTPGKGIEEMHTFDYQQSTFIIDINDRSGNLIWRVSSTNNLTAPLSLKLIEGIVDRGFRKFKKMQRLKK
ncbi:MAG: DUF4136 domain-containing protein [Cyclobacteriaceae bacterium]|jgi:hypothetical protein